MPTPHEAFLSLMREALQEPSLTLEAALGKPMAKALLTAVESSRVPEAKEAAALLPPVTPRLFKAALEDTFDMAALQPEQAQRSFLLNMSDLVVIGGERRLRLNERARAEILAAARKNKDLYAEQLSTAVEADEQEQGRGQTASGLTSVWLRRFLSGRFDPSALDRLSPAELKAAHAARDRLRLLEGLPSTVPSLPELNRRAGVAELLEPLRVLIGADVPESNGRRDRFVGRADQLSRLRAFVNEVSAFAPGFSWGAFVESAQRTITALGSRPRGGLMIVEARGGLGKSALMAKFVLDHALQQSRAFPFAYLDFDRSSLDPHRPHQLLLEITRQVALQVPSAPGAFNSFAQDLRAELAQVAPSDGPRRTDSISDPFSRFVELLREHATFQQRAFLLVLDTMEVVQWDAVATEKVAGLIQELLRKGLDEMRVVACGRADVPELRKAFPDSGKIQSLVLPPLSADEAKQMANCLGEYALGKEWKGQWADAIVGNQGGLWQTLVVWKSEVRREPLAVRVAVDIITSAPVAQRESEAAEIAALGVEGSEQFIERLYEKRIQNHIRDPRAARLAWPGLVIRRLTVEIVRDVLAELCQIPVHEAEAAFKSLGREIWIVVPDGEALRHRPDLRARMLPLMRRKHAEVFAAVARQAAEYYGGRKDNPDDFVEWLYYRLLANEPIDGISRDMTADALARLGAATEDFAPDSGAASYLASHTASRRLPPWRIHEMVAEDALRHLAETTQSVFALDDVTLDPVALKTADRLEQPLDETLGPWAEALWVKTGAWEKVRWPHIPRADEARPALRLALYYCARVSTSRPAPGQSYWFGRAFGAVSTERGSYDSAAGFRTLVQAMALARTIGLNDFPRLDDYLATTLEKTKPNAEPSMQAALRTAIVFGEACRAPALKLWLRSRRRGRGERVRTASVSLWELRTLSGTQSEVAHLFSHIPEKDQREPARLIDERILSDWTSILEQHIGDSHSHEGRGRSLAEVFACRQEDWIVPLAYAAARAVGVPVPRVVATKLASYCRFDNSKDPAFVLDKVDWVTAMRIADEAGDLLGFVEMLLDQRKGDGAAWAGLEHLLQQLRAWIDAVAGKIVWAPHAIEKSEAAFSSEPPPAPPPGRHHDDLQKERWGGLAERDGRRLSGVLESVERNTFYFSLIVESTDASPLDPPVVFHLHDSFPRSIVRIRRIIGGQRAELSEWSAYGVFAVGAQVKNAQGKWISLEYDLAKLPNLPQRFLDS